MILMYAKNADITGIAKRQAYKIGQEREACPLV